MGKFVFTGKVTAADWSRAVPVFFRMTDMQWQAAHSFSFKALVLLSQASLGEHLLPFPFRFFPHYHWWMPSYPQGGGVQQHHEAVFGAEVEKQCPQETKQASYSPATDPRTHSFTRCWRSQKAGRSWKAYFKCKSLSLWTTNKFCRVPKLLRILCTCWEFECQRHPRNEGCLLCL